MHMAANRFRRLVAAVLILGLSICCCQAHLLFAGFSDPVTVAISSCCEQCPGEEPADSQPDERPAPLGCQACCAKGTGLEQSAVLALSAADVLALLTLPAAIARSAPDRPEALHRVDATDLRIEPQTLVRMHCALIV